MTERFLIGIDDTDFGESIGTGALARELNLHLQRTAGLESLGVTRHQLLVHPDIPYTSHNSAACIAVSGRTSVADLAEVCARFVAFLRHDGADPGLCVVEEDGVAEELMKFGQRAQLEVVRKAEAAGLASDRGIVLLELGGTGLGIIGALCACALRATGDDGRFVTLAGIRDVSGERTAAEILASSAVRRVIDDHGRPLAGTDLIDTRGWVRPDLVSGEPVLRVARTGEGRFVTTGRKKDEG